MNPFEWTQSLEAVEGQSESANRFKGLRPLKGFAFLISRISNEQMDSTSEVESIFLCNSNVILIKVVMSSWTLLLKWSPAIHFNIQLNNTLIREEKIFLNIVWV